ncbi:GAF domain-containing protein [Conexibacter sp. SYSU D00693]|uniref:helix-turn-helix domain-containing protein n=1 Tax=Conexibacter sp. SYSU D00693 TaxID=2812560 RepID=UPI00196AC941|nr:GAF domain-containing protein [Conexibacter sp. SYSU D00693]
MSLVLAPEAGVAGRLHAYEALIAIGDRLHGASADVEGALAMVVEQAQGLLRTDMAWLTLADEEGVLRPMHLRGFRSDAFLHVSLPAAMGVGGRAIRRGAPLVIDDYATFEHPTRPAVRDTMLAEGAVTIVCAPMHRDGELVGTLYVANRRATVVTEEETWLLGALAAQASMAIASRRLHHRLLVQNDALERLFGMHRRLVQASLEEQGLTGLAEVLADLVGRPLLVEQDICEPRTLRVASRGVDAGLGPDPRPVDSVHPIQAGMTQLGSITVLGEGLLSPLATSALEQGATMLALELLKQRAAVEVGWQLSGDLLEELLAAPQPVPEALVRRARHLHVDVTAPHRVIALGLVNALGDRPTRLLELARGLVAKRALGHGSRALAMRRGTEVLVALPDELARHTDDVLDALRDLARPVVGELHAGVGSLDVDLAASARAATSCLRLARSAEAPGAVVHYDAFGSLRFLLDAADVRNAALIAREPLVPLIEHDRAHRTPLLETTRAFLEVGGHHGRCAARCYIASSTLKYRLAKVEHVLGAHPSDPELGFRLTLAFKVHDLLEVLGVDPA